MNSADKLKIREIGVGFKNRTSFKNTGTAFPLTNRAAMLYWGRYKRTDK